MMTSKTNRIWMDDQDGLIVVGDVLDGLEHLDDESVEAIVTDPPYELKFMGKSWDQSGVSFQPETWAACLRVLKPGGHMVVFGGTRTHHRMWCAIEDAGFEVRDMLLWLYGQGFPKSHSVGQAVEKLLTTGKARRPDRDLGVGRRYDHAATDPTYSKEVRDTGGQVPLTVEEAQQWDGWGTALKPGCEPILLARKPLAEKNVAANVLKHGTGALNIDATRLDYLNEADKASATPQGRVTSKETAAIGAEPDAGRGLKRVEFKRPEQKGRWPANAVLQCTCDDPQPVPEKVKSRAKEPAKDRRYVDKGATNITGNPGATRREGGGFAHESDCPAGMLDVQTDGASRFFYCAKATKKERGEGNVHPTVKPIALMRWLVRLVTPPDGIVVDPFCGSGSTLVAAVEEGFGFVGIDIDPDYCTIAQRRAQQTEETKRG